MKRKSRRRLLPNYVTNELSILIKGFLDSQGGNSKLSNFSFEPFDHIDIYPVSGYAELTINDVIKFKISFMSFTKMGKYRLDIKKEDGMSISFSFRAHGWDGDLKGEPIILDDHIKVIETNLMHVVVYSFALIQFKLF